MRYSSSSVSTTSIVACSICEGFVPCTGCNLDATHLPTSQGAQNGRGELLRLLLILVLLVFILVLIVTVAALTRRTVDKLDRSTARLVRNLVTERDVGDPEVRRRGDDGGLARRNLHTPTKAAEKRVEKYYLRVFQVVYAPEGDSDGHFVKSEWQER